MKLLLPFALIAATSATAAGYRLPYERPITLPPGPDAELTSAICSACHSLDYLRTQPRGKGAQFWSDSVTKMVKVYGAPIDPADAKRITAYLAATYGTPAEGAGN
jgi:predicted secreted protein